MKRGAAPISADWESGATAVEFALLVPMFLMLVYGAIEFGRVLWTEQALQETAFASARCMAIAQGTKPNRSCASSGSYSSSNTTSYVQNVAAGWGLSLPSSGVSLSTSANCGGSSGGFSQVTLTSTFNSVAPKLVKLNAGGVTLTASACYPNNS
jgi:Flp pilus assembly protein TadG